jgi:hypothetical protein
MLSTHLCWGYRSRWCCTSSRVGCSRWLQWVVPLHVRQKLECLWIVLQLGRRLRDSWMASCWGRLGGGLWTCATFALQSKQLSARVISTEMVRPTIFNAPSASARHSKYHTTVLFQHILFIASNTCTIHHFSLYTLITTLYDLHTFVLVHHHLLHLNHCYSLSFLTLLLNLTL